MRRVDGKEESGTGTLRMRGRGLLKPITEESAHHIFDRRTKELLGVIFPPLTEGVGAMSFWGGWSKPEFLAVLLEFPHGGSTFLLRGTRFASTA